jgi:hypothetical protein
MTDSKSVAVVIDYAYMESYIAIVFSISLGLPSPSRKALIMYFS